MAAASPRTTCVFSPDGDRRPCLTKEIAFTPARVLMQDFTGVPAVVDLGAMRDAMKKMGGDPKLINPLQPADLVIDHSVQVDEFATIGAFVVNAELELPAQQGALCFSALGTVSVPQFQSRAARHGNCPPGESGISRSRRVL